MNNPRSLKLDGNKFSFETPPEIIPISNGRFQRLISDRLTQIQTER